MSATLDTESLAAYLGEAPVFKLDAPVFPVAVEYLPASKEMRLEQQVVRAVQTFQENNSQTGDVLIFLPGMAEIRRCQDALSARGHPGWKILPLHGELPREEQALVFKKFRERKLILSTNVAETSLTIDGVTAVIDGGLHRQADFSWWSGIPALKTKPGRTNRAGEGSASLFGFRFSGTASV
jgi:ATP-dependent helicase HrpB